MESEKTDIEKSYFKSRNRDTDVEKKCIDLYGGGDEMNWKIGIDLDTPSILYIKLIINEKQVYKHRKLFSSLCGDLNGKEIQKVRILRITGLQYLTLYDLRS